MFCKHNTEWHQRKRRNRKKTEIKNKNHSGGFLLTIKASSLPLST